MYTKKILSSFTNTLIKRSSSSSSLINSSSSISHLSLSTSTSVSKIVSQQHQQGQSLYQSNSIFQRVPSSFVVGHRYLSTQNNEYVAYNSDVLNVPKLEAEPIVVDNKQEGTIWIDSIDNIQFDMRIFILGSPLKTLIENIQHVAPKGIKLVAIDDRRAENGCYVNFEFDSNSTSIQEIMDKIKSNAVKYNLVLNCLEARGQIDNDDTTTGRSLVVTFDGKEIPLSELHSLLSTYGTINQMKTKSGLYLGGSKKGVVVTFDNKLSSLRAKKCLYDLTLPQSKTTLKFKSTISATTVLMAALFVSAIVYHISKIERVQELLQKGLESIGGSEAMVFGYLGENGKTVIEAVYPSGQKLIVAVEGGDLKNTQLQFQLTNTQSSTDRPQIKTTNYPKSKGWFSWNA
ncbi:hypothetical protein DFA_10240 [Cavenderia fasciculata]|uniref:RRM domain-containing protein n=1 Tax=Cavenderia fasciculata TaxID=261658 RepID=F4Q9N6_CACFS|nr:uncharacterized protein DFA_10240 [Cavenderia fasciculata]EGG15405.1 hypothetical protein DFA_10240 [Cavenderia fasciculata]|eukprot:XP_004354147.1 hypothetical protein DFA_10240 [Cavenderia fasciculata]